MKRLLIFLLMLILSFALFAQNRGLMFLGSLAVPGLSQISQGKDYGYVMLASEAAIISGMLYLNSEEKIAQREAYEFAIKYAHIEPGNYPQSYFRNLSRFNSGGFEADGYNAKILKEAMAQYPDDPVKQQEYINQNAYPEDIYWSWDSTSKRAAYSKIRIKASDMRDYSSAAVGVLILNHLISGIDVLRLTAANKRSQMYMSLKGKNPLLNVSFSF